MIRGTKVHVAPRIFSRRGRRERCWIAALPLRECQPRAGEHACGIVETKSAGSDWPIEPACGQRRRKIVKDLICLRRESLPQHIDNAEVRMHRAKWLVKTFEMFKIERGKWCNTSHEVTERRVVLTSDLAGRYSFHTEPFTKR